jgi:hypothetical protein
MKEETPEEKWKRVQGQVQDGILNAYPNPERRGCPDNAGILALARRSAQFDDNQRLDQTLSFHLPLTKLA